MNRNKLAKFLACRIERHHLYVAVPTLGWSFGSDNYQDLVRAFNELPDHTPVIIRQFTNMKSSVPMANNPQEFLPIKRVAALLVFEDENAETTMLTADEIKDCYSYCHKTGKPIPLDKDLIFTDAKKMFELIS